MSSARVVTRWAMQRVLWAAALVAAGLAAAWAEPGPRTDGGHDALAELNAAIVSDPGNSALNLRYAKLAEAQGLWRLALAAYERILVNDPDNAEALAGLQRVRLQLQPASTRYTVEIGAVAESNPRYLPTGFKGEAQAEAAFGLQDERTLGEMRWRTTLAALGLLHQIEGDLNYAFVGATTGPVFNLAPGWFWHPAIGAAVSFFDERFYYGEANANLAIEDASAGLYSRLWFRVGYRQYENFFVSHQGIYADAVGRFALPLGAADLLVLSPWLRLSDINGFFLAPALLFSEIQPGSYGEGGAKLELYHGLTEGLLIGASLASLARAYQTDVPTTTEKRRDLLITPGASLVFPNLWSIGTDLRIDYRYICDRSTDPAQSFTDHVITTAIAKRF